MGSNFALLSGALVAAGLAPPRRTGRCSGSAYPGMGKTSGFDCPAAWHWLCLRGDRPGVKSDRYQHDGYGL